jgi:hypothetical protein
MSGKILVQMESPKTQSIEAVKALLSWQGKSTEPLPAAITLDGAQLTRSKKGDCFYVTTATDCSCPARCFNPGTACKHMRSLLAGNSREASKAQAKAYQARQRALKEQARTAPTLPEPTEHAKRLVVPPEKMNFFLEDSLTKDLPQSFEAKWEALQEGNLAHTMAMNGLVRTSDCL